MKDWGKFLVVTLAGIILAALVSYAINEDAAAAEASEIEAAIVTPQEREASIAFSQALMADTPEMEEAWCPAMEIEDDRPVQTPLPPEITEPVEEDGSFVDADGNVWYFGETLDEDNQDFVEPEDDSEDEYVEEESEDEDEGEPEEDDFDWSSSPVIDVAPIDFDPDVNYLFSE